MTHGGAGRRIANYDLIHELGQEDKNRAITDIRKITGYNHQTAKRALKAWGVTDEKIKERGHNAMSKLIKARNIETDEITKYPSASEAARQLGINQGHISSCCKGKKKTLRNSNGGIYQFAYEGEEFSSLENYNSARARAVIATDLITGEETEYLSAAEAGRQTGINASNIIQCCKGKYKSAAVKRGVIKKVRRNKNFRARSGNENYRVLPAG